MIYCQIRKKPVAKTPEEGVRQSVIHHMITSLNFPASLIAVEKELGEVKRRVDIAAYTKDESGGLSPLLLVECKAGRVTQDAITQVLGYNFFLLAPFFAVAGRDGIVLFDKRGGIMERVPQYEELIRLK